MGDISLVAQVVVFHNTRAFDQLVKKYQSPVRRFFLHQTCGDSELSDDLAQDTFIKAYTNIASFKNLSSFSTWLYRIAYNVFYDYIRSRKETDDLDTYRVDAQCSTLQQDVGQHMDIYRALATLKEMERTCITLFYMEDQSIEKIAGITGCPAGTVKSHLSRAKEKMATYYQKQAPKASRSLLGNFVQQDDIILLVTPIDESAPKGRMILPQVQAIRSILDEEAICLVVQPQQLQRTLSLLKQLPKLVVTDSQAFQRVNQIVPPEIALTSFSILYAHYHDVLQKAVTAAATLECLQNHDRILIAEGCTHHRQCNDIGTVKLPNWIQTYTGKTLDFTWTSGNAFPDDLTPYRLIVHCGGCMLQPRVIQYRKELAAKAGVPFTNYGTLIAYVHGILRRSVSIFPELQEKMPHHIHETD